MYDMTIAAATPIFLLAIFVGLIYILGLISGLKRDFHALQRELRNFDEVASKLSKLRPVMADFWTKQQVKNHDEKEG